VSDDKKGYDNVKKPYHYHICGEIGEDGRSVFEPIKVIEAWGYAEGFYLGSAIKYVLRAPYKGAERQDLEKAYFYLCRLSDCIELRNRSMRIIDFSMSHFRVSEAWKLPECLQKAIENIAIGHCKKAAEYVKKHLDLMEEKCRQDVDEEESK